MMFYTVIAFGTTMPMFGGQSATYRMWSQVAWYHQVLR